MAPRDGPVGGRRPGPSRGCSWPRQQRGTRQQRMSAARYAERGIAAGVEEPPRHISGNRCYRVIPDRVLQDHATGHIAIDRDLAADIRQIAIDGSSGGRSRAYPEINLERVEYR